MSDASTCSACGTENRPGRKFCSECGAALAVLCAACGAANEPGERFCGECGCALEAAPPVASVPAPVAERRLVSVLFADLVGFTSLSEDRDAEEVRELLSRYFESCSRLIERYGGTVEKFIGDAVMAVWGAPVAQEDDAERAVRTALDLVAALSALGDELGAPDLRLRAGVATGEAAVTLGAEGQGMVAGDLVNTASRVQSEAEPGSVLVDDATRRATEAAIAYEDAGEHDLKGKAEPVRLSRALRVTAGRAGALKPQALEPPFVGRDRELRQLKELLHATIEEGRAHLVSVTGSAGAGKSRFAWELYKYVDGLAETINWHRGRCLAYGEGVAYWALAEMIRMRAGIAEGEDPRSARAKLRETTAEYVPDAEERAWIEPRLAHLLGLEERMAADKQDLFAAWRLFLERMTDQYPTVLVFDDMQWADASLIEFVEYLLEWSRAHPLYVVSLARPDLSERYPGFGARRNSTSIYLEPLPDAAMTSMLDGLVPGLSDQLRLQILARAEGVPLYAVETVRMLLDRGLLRREESEYRPTGPIEALEVPETLHALVAARLDGLEQEERRLVQDASVLGKTFTREAIAALNRPGESELEPLLARLVRKEVLSIQADPRSPERGQYFFVQDLLRQVAYETLAKRERKARHLAAAASLEEGFGPADVEIVEVLAAHYLAAYQLAPDDEDAPEVKGLARQTLVRAADRAASLAAAGEAQRAYEQAASLAEDPGTEAGLLERAGEMAFQDVQTAVARERLQRAIELYEQDGDRHAAARASARLGDVDLSEGRHDEAAVRLEQAYEVLAGEADAGVAAIAAQLGRVYFLRGELDRAAKSIDRALELAETLRLYGTLTEAMTTRAGIVHFQSRLEESVALNRHAIALALEHGINDAALRAHNNLAYELACHDRWSEAIEVYEQGIALARRVGARMWELTLLGSSIESLIVTGRCDEALERGESVLAYDATTLQRVVMETSVLAELRLMRGELDEARDLLQRAASLARSPESQARATHARLEAGVALAEGRPADALAAAQKAIALYENIGWTDVLIKESVRQAIEAALELGNLELASDLVEHVKGLRPGWRTPSLEAQAARLGALIAARQGREDEVEPGLEAAAAIFRTLEIPFWLAVVLLEHGEWLLEQGRAEEAEPLLAEARAGFVRLGATPWLERLDAAGQTPAATAV